MADTGLQCEVVLRLHARAHTHTYTYTRSVDSLGSQAVDQLCPVHSPIAVSMTNGSRHLGPGSRLFVASGGGGIRN